MNAKIEAARRVQVAELATSCALMAAERRRVAAAIEREETMPKRTLLEKGPRDGVATVRDPVAANSDRKNIQAVHYPDGKFPSEKILEWKRRGKKWNETAEEWVEIQPGFIMLSVHGRTVYFGDISPQKSTHHGGDYYRATTTSAEMGKIREAKQAIIDAHRTYAQVVDAIWYISEPINADNALEMLGDCGVPIETR